MFPREYLLPYVISNLVGLSILATAFRWPGAVRWIWVTIFVWTATVNTFTASTQPWEYLAYGWLTPSDLYREFIVGWFSRHIAPVVLSIAAGQLVVAMLLMRTGAARRLGVFGAVVFLLAIAPLGIGSGFPFSLTAIASLLVMEWRWPGNRRRSPSPASAFVPRADVVDERSIVAQAPPALVFDVAREADLLGSPVAAAIFRIRARLLGDKPRPRRATGVVAETLALGWGVLSYIPGQTLVMGAVARPWVKDVTFSAVEPSQFVSFAEPDLVKIVWTLEVEAIGSGTRLRTETRVVATDAGARRRFLGYWMVVSPGIKLIRWLMLRSVRLEAEARSRAASRPERQAA